MLSKCAVTSGQQSALCRNPAGVICPCTQAPSLCLFCEFCQTQRELPICHPCGKAVILQGLSTPLEITPSFDLGPQTPGQIWLLPIPPSHSPCPLSGSFLQPCLPAHCCADLSCPRALACCSFWGVTVLWLLAWRSPCCPLGWPLFRLHPFKEVLPVHSDLFTIFF